MNKFMSNSMADLITPRQLVPIRIIANQLRVDAEALCRERYDCEVVELSRKTASAFIDFLKLEQDKRFAEQSAA